MNSSKKETLLAFLFFVVIVEERPIVLTRFAIDELFARAALHDDACDDAYHQADSHQTSQPAKRAEQKINYLIRIHACSIVLRLSYSACVVPSASLPQRTLTTPSASLPQRTLSVLPPPRMPSARPSHLAACNAIRNAVASRWLLRAPPCFASRRRTCRPSCDAAAQQPFSML